MAWKFWRRTPEVDPLLVERVARALAMQASVSGGAGPECSASHRRGYLNALAGPLVRQAAPQASAEQRQDMRHQVVALATELLASRQAAAPKRMAA